MRDAANAVLPDELGDRTIAKHPSGRRGKHQVGIVGQLEGLFECRYAASAGIATL